MPSSLLSGLFRTTALLLSVLAGTVFATEVVVGSYQGWLRAQDWQVGERYGAAVAMDGDMRVVGASEDGDLGPSSGSIYVFKQFFGQFAKLNASDGQPGDRFGSAVALAGSTICSGAPLHASAATDAGAVYVFTGSDSSWTEQAKLVASNASAGDAFGSAVAIHGDTAVEEAALSPTSVEPPDAFGFDLALQGDRLVVLAPYDDDAGTDAGAVFVFHRVGAAWSQETKLTPAAFSDAGSFRGISLSGPHLAIEATGGGLGGQVLVLAEDGDGWAELHRFIVPDASFAVRSSTLGECSAILGSTFSSRVAVFEFDELFSSFCDATDDALAACPCSNPGSPDAGCDVAQGTGGVALTVLGQQTTPQNRATLQGTGFPPMGSPTVLAIRSMALDATSPAVFGNGLRCLGAPIVRLTATFASGGVSVQTVPHGAMGGSGLRYYQLWFRDTPVMFCTPDAFNLSSGRALVG
jgi:hypothetical protein